MERSEKARARLLCMQQPAGEDAASAEQVHVIVLDDVTDGIDL